MIECRPQGRCYKENEPVIFRTVLMALVFVGASSMAMAMSSPPPLPCRADVRKFCFRIPQSAGNKAFYDCLIANRNILSPQCQRALLSEH
jgi:hypothetical protein